MMTSRKFLVYFLLLSATVILATIIFEIWSFRRAIDHTLHQNLLFATSVARNIGGVVEDEKSIAQALLDAYDRSAEDPKGLASALDTLRTANADIEALAIFGSDRQLLAGEFTAINRPPLEVLLPALRKAETSPTMVLTDLWKGSDRRARLAVVLGRGDSVAKAAKPEGAQPAAGWRGAVAVLRIDGPRFSKIFERFVVDPSARLQLLDSSGVALYSTDSTETFRSVVHGTYFTDKVRLGGTVQMQCHSCHLGERHDEPVREQEITTVAPVPGTEWTVTVRERAQRLYAPMTETIYLSTALVCLIFGLFVGFYVLLSRRVLRPMRQLAVTATRLMSGSEPTLAVSGEWDEFEVLSNSLRALQNRPADGPAKAEPAAQTAPARPQQAAVSDLPDALALVLDSVVASEAVASVLMHLRGWPLQAPYFAARGATLRAEGVPGDVLTALSAGCQTIAVAELRDHGVAVDDCGDTRLFMVLPIVVGDALSGQLWIGIADSGEAVIRYLGPALRLIANQVQALIERLLLQGHLRREQAHKNRMLRHLFDAEAEERKRIAREIHDQTAQELTALMLMLETAGEATPQAAAKQLGKAKALVAQILDGLNRLVRRLRPAVLDDLGLVEALRTTAQNLLEPAGIAFELEVIGSDAGLSREVESGVYRVFQEAATNSVRHAGAKHVRMRLCIEADQLSGWLQDDGKGMDLSWLDDLAARPRWGLLGMRERIVQLGGTIEFAAASQGGLRIVFGVPLTPAEEAPAPSPVHV